MKKILLVVMLLFSSLLLVGCNETVPNEGSVTLSITESYYDYIKYEDVPSFTLNFEGNLNTIDNNGVYDQLSDDILNQAKNYFNIE